MLKVNKIAFKREYQFYPPRKWRFDFVIMDESYQFPDQMRIAVEVEGGNYTGGHRRYGEADKDCEKHNEAMHDGWKVFRVTPDMVHDGRALLTVERAIGRHP